MDTEQQAQSANISAPSTKKHPSPNESIEHTEGDKDNQKEKRKRPREPVSSSTDGDSSDSELGPEALELIRKERKKLKKRIRHLTHLAAIENEHEKRKNPKLPTSNNSLTESPQVEKSIDRQTSSGFSSTSRVIVPAQGHLPTPAAPQDRNHIVEISQHTADTDPQSNVRTLAETVRPPSSEFSNVPATPTPFGEGRALPQLPNPSHQSPSENPHHESNPVTTPSAISKDLMYNEKSLPDERMGDYGEPVTVPQAEGLFATRHYPNREAPLKMPTGAITKQAYAFRYRDLSTTAVVEKIRAIQERSEQCPVVYQHALKSSAKGNFDAQVHRWLTPVFRNYHLLGENRQARSRYLREIVLPDLFKQFPDLHPDYIKVRDTKMEKDYLDKIRNTISAAYHQLRPKLAVSGKVEMVDKEIVKCLTETSQPPRPHDLWARDQLDPLDENGEEKNDLSQFAKDWEAKKAQCLEALGAEEWEDMRLSIEQEFRKAAFERRPAAEQDLWTRKASAKKKPVDKMIALIRGLPFFTHVAKRFGELAEVPMAILIGAPDPQDSSNDTFGGPAPAHIEDFWSGPNQLGTRQILPEWRRFVADVFEKSADAIRSEPQALPEFAPDPEVPITEPTERVVLLNGIRFVVTPPPANWCIPSPERDEIINNLRIALGESWSQGNLWQATCGLQSNGGSNL
ncbi:hypothetical protein FS837_012807 [Tulasnella sp. UAMH 9824]|nr:hypothetical protein FS837_012807 [Tulasnella sp. UAMH 9824]